jgi:hypothetical protein
MNEIEEGEANHEAAYSHWVQCNAIADIAIFKCSKAIAKREKAIAIRNEAVKKLDLACAKHKSNIADAEKNGLEEASAWFTNYLSEESKGQGS